MTNYLDRLERLIGFDTTSSRSNLEFIEFMRDCLLKIGAAVEIIPGHLEGKASLWARVGPPTAGGVVLSGHSDVVPVRDQAWSSDPFKLRIQDGRVHGRGAVDMKGFLAVALSTLEQLDPASLKRPIYLAVTYDEEVGCTGAPSLIDWAVRKGGQPSAVFVGEPTGMTVVNAHKGLCVCRTEIRGVEAHSSLAHLGVSAVGLAGRAIAMLHQLEADLRQEQSDSRFDPSYSTISVNWVEGGTAANILAGRCAFIWDIRSIPAANASAIRAEFHDRVSRHILNAIQARQPLASLTTAILADAPGLRPETLGPAEQLAIELSGNLEPKAAPYAAEAGQYQAAGFSTVIIGPGSIEQAHQPDEYVELEQLQVCERFIKRLASHLA